MNMEEYEKFFKRFLAELKKIKPDQSFTSPDGETHISYVLNFGDELESGNETREEKLNRLKFELDEAVRTEDYLVAAELKKQIDQELGKEDKIKELRKLINEAVKKEDYLVAAELKKQIDSL
jgi:protein-arginine kinase activator protein McsA